MDKYKRKVKMCLVRVLALLGLAVFGLVATLNYPLDEHMIPFMTGAIVSLLVITYYHFRLLRNEDKLRKAYVEENDERNQLIENKAQTASSYVLLLGLTIAIIVFAFNDVEKMFLCSAILWSIIILRFIFTIYYKKKL